MNESNLNEYLNNLSHFNQSLDSELTNIDLGSPSSGPSEIFQPQSQTASPSEPPTFLLMKTFRPQGVRDALATTETKF